MLTPGELQERIYNATNNYGNCNFNDVLNEIQSNYEMLYSRCVDFNSRIENLNSTIQYYMSIENTLKNALFLAEKVSEEKIEEASQKAKTIEKDALNKADEIVSDAKNELTTIRENISTLQVEYEKYLIEYRDLVKCQLDHIEKDALSLADKKKSVTYALPDQSDTKKNVNNNTTGFDSASKKSEEEPVSEFAPKGNNSVFNTASSDQVIIDAEVTPIVDTFETKSKSASTTYGIAKPVFGVNNNSTFFDDFGNGTTTKKNTDDLAKGIEKASQKVEDMTSSISSVSNDFNKAGAKHADTAQNLENTAEILFNNSSVTTEPQTYQAPVESIAPSPVQPIAQDNTQTVIVKPIKKRKKRVISPNAEYSDNEEYTNFSTNNYSQGFDASYHQQYNPQYNDTFKQYDYSANGNQNIDTPSEPAPLESTLDTASKYEMYDIPQGNSYDYSYKTEHVQVVQPVEETKTESKGGFMRRRKKFL